MDISTMITTIQEALAALGVTDQTLSPEEKRCIDEEGYVILPDATPPHHPHQLQLAYDLHDTDKGFSLRPNDNMNDEEGGGRHTNLEYLSPAFDIAYTNPRHLAAT